MLISILFHDFVKNNQEIIDPYRMNNFSSNQTMPFNILLVHCWKKDEMINPMRMSSQSAFFSFLFSFPCFYVFYDFSFRAAYSPRHC